MNTMPLVRLTHCVREGGADEEDTFPLEPSIDLLSRQPLLNL
jgi:hypothetical protein